MVGSTVKENEQPISCDAYCAKFVPCLLLMPILGVIIWSLNESKLTARSIEQFLHVFGGTLAGIDVFLLPRSRPELPFIKENFSRPFFDLALLMMTLCAMIGSGVTVFAAIGALKRENPLLPSKSRFVVGGFVVVAMSLVFRHPYVGRVSSVLGNQVDPAGFYFLRESTWIAGGYYSLALIAANLFSFRLPSI